MLYDWASLPIVAITLYTKIGRLAVVNIATDEPRTTTVADF